MTPVPARFRVRRRPPPPRTSLERRRALRPPPPRIRDPHRWPRRLLRGSVGLLLVAATVSGGSAAVFEVRTIAAHHDVHTLTRRIAPHPGAPLPSQP